MPSGKVPSFTDYAGGQSPDDVAYICKTPFGPTDDRFSTLDDLYSIITKNITDLTVRFQDSVSAAPAVSSANTGAINYNATTQTFQGSRNGSAYTDLLFGAGANTQIAYWSALQDELNGSASWTFNNTTKTVTLSNASNTPNLIVQNTSATTPNEVRLHLSVPTVQAIGFDATGNGGEFHIYGGRTGPLFPLSGAVLGSLQMRGVNGAGAAPTTRGGGRIDFIATSNLSLTEGGSGMIIASQENGATSDTIRFTITGSGACILGANGTSVTASLGGTDTLVSIGNLTTYDPAAAIQIGNPATGPTAVKTLVVQANPSQTASIIETQSSGGGGQFQVRVSAGNGNHFLSLLGNVGSVPAVSTATQWRIYCSSAGRLMLSEGGGAYTTLVTGTGSGMAIGNTITSATAGSVLFAGAAGVLAQDNTNLFWDDSNNYLGLGINSSLAARLHVVADVGNNGIRVDSNSGTINSVWSSDGSTAYLGTSTNHTLELLTNGSARLSITGAGTSTFNGAAIVQSSAAAAFAVGPTGNTNPMLRIVANVASAATGLSITGNAAGSGVTLSVLTSGTNENLRINPAGTGGVGINTDPTAVLHIKCRATSNEGIQVDSNNGAVNGVIYSDGSDLFIGALTNDEVQLIANGSSNIRFTDTTLGFFAVSPIAKPTITGSRAGNAALADLLTQLALYGLIVDGTSA